MAQEKISASAKLTELLKLQVGSISETIEKEGRTIFGGSNNLLGTDEITDFCIEFLQLLVALLESRDPHDDGSPQFHALEMFFNSLSKQILVRGVHGPREVHAILVDEPYFL